MTDLYDIGAFFTALEEQGFKPADFGESYRDNTSFLNLNLFELEGIVANQLELVELDGCASDQDHCLKIVYKFINTFQEKSKMSETVATSAKYQLFEFDKHPHRTIDFSQHQASAEWTFKVNELKVGSSLEGYRNGQLVHFNIIEIIHPSNGDTGKIAAITKMAK